jgi:hypothetical protein
MRNRQVLDLILMECIHDELGQIARIYFCGICNAGNLVSKMTFNNVYKPKLGFFIKNKVITFIMYNMPLF